VAWRPDGLRVASCGSDGTVRVWRPSAGQATQAAAPLVLEGHGGSVLGLAYSPDGTQLASCGQDGAVKVV
jgi:WD40 repeat protein